MASKRLEPVDPFNADDPIMPWDDEGERAPVDGASTTAGTHDGYWVGDARQPQGTKRAKSRSALASPSQDGHAPQKPTGKRGKAAGKGRRTRSDKHTNRAVLAIVLVFVLLNAIGGVASFGMASCTTTDVRDILGFDGSTSPAYETDAAGWQYDDAHDELCSQAEHELSAFVDRMAGADEELVTRAAGLLEASFRGYGSKTTLAKLGIDTTELATWVLSRTELSTGTLSSYALAPDERDEAWDVAASAEISFVYADDLTYDLARYVADRFIGNSALVSADGTPSAELARDAQEQVVKFRQHYDSGGLSSTTYLSLEFDGHYDADAGEASLEVDEDDVVDSFDQLFGIYGD